MNKLFAKRATLSAGQIDSEGYVYWWLYTKSIFGKWKLEADGLEPFKFYNSDQVSTHLLLSYGSNIKIITHGE